MVFRLVCSIILRGIKCVNAIFSLSRVTEKMGLDNFADELRFGHLLEATVPQLSCMQSVPTEIQRNVKVLTEHITVTSAAKDSTTVEVIGVLILKAL